jgi:hypothetical protein
MEQVIQDIYSLLDKGLEVKDIDAQLFGERMATLLKQRLAPRDDTPTLRLSMLGKPDTQIYFEMKGIKGEPLTPVNKMKFLYGDLIEEMVLTLADLSGHRVTERQKKVTIEGVNGHIDAKIDGELIDVKSCSSYGFQKFQEKNLGSDSFGYITQISGYAQADGQQKGSFIAMDKSTGELTAMEVKEEDFVDVTLRIKHIKRMLAEDREPTRTCTIKKEENGNEFLSSPCSYCSHKRNCHPKLRVFQYYDGPRYFTKVVKEPRVNEIK